MSQSQTLPIKPGDTLTVEEPDYMYGLGPLHLRVSKVGRVVRLPDGDWLDLEGYTLRADGSLCSPKPRHTSVRLTAIRNARRATGA
jgi:hypothetical protein